MYSRAHIALVVLTVICFSCNETVNITDPVNETSRATSESAEEAILEVNPPAEGFDVMGSDSAAIAIADEVMEAMGGRRNWDKARYISWGFSGRNWIWDRKGGRIRYETDKTTILFNLFKDGGKVYNKKDSAFKNFPAEEIEHAFIKGYKAGWMNDSYWLLMPFKLKDTGVRLSYVGEKKNLSGKASDVIKLNFVDSVGVTPGNEYDVYVDKKTRLVNQWSFYGDSATADPNFSLTWGGYQEFGDVKLSGARGDGSETKVELTDLGIYTELPDEVFTSVDPVDLSQYK